MVVPCDDSSADFKLMRNAVGGRSVLRRALKVGADVPQ